VAFKLLNFAYGYTGLCAHGDI